MTDKIHLITLQHYNTEDTAQWLQKRQASWQKRRINLHNGKQGTGDNKGLENLMKTRFTWQPYDKEEILNTKVSTTDGNKTKHNDIQKNAGDKQDKRASKQDTTGNKQGQPVDQQDTSVMTNKANLYTNRINLTSNNKHMKTNRLMTNKVNVTTNRFNLMTNITR